MDRAAERAEGFERLALGFAPQEADQRNIARRCHTFEQVKDALLARAIQRKGHLLAEEQCTHDQRCSPRPQRMFGTCPQARAAAAAFGGDDDAHDSAHL